MDRKIKVIGVESYVFKAPDGNEVPMASVHYTYKKNNVNGLACGRFTCSEKMISRYGVELDTEYIGVFYNDANKKEKCAALFVEG